MGEELIIFDFKDFPVVSNSFADELFGELVSDMGLEFLKKRSTFANVSPLVNIVIRNAIDRQIAQKEDITKN